MWHAAFLINYPKSDYMNLIFSVKIYTILVNIPSLHRVSSRWHGIEQINDFTRSPGPKHLIGEIVWNAQVNVNRENPLGIQLRGTVFPCRRVIANGVVEGVEHSPCLIEIADTKMIAGFILPVPHLHFRKFRLREQTPVTGRLWQGTDWAGGKHTLVPPAYIGNGIIGAVVTADHISSLWNIAGPIRWDIDRAIGIVSDSLAAGSPSCGIFSPASPAAASPTPMEPPSGLRIAR